MAVDVARPGRPWWGQSAPIVWAIALAALGFSSSAAKAQPSGSARGSPPYRLRCAADRVVLCANVERAMRIRGGVVVRVGDAIEAYRAESRDVVLGAIDETTHQMPVTLVASEGTELRTLVEIPEDADAAVRALVLAIEALVDLDLTPARGSARATTRVLDRAILPDVPRGSGITTWHDPRPRTVMARPVFFGRVLGGISLERGDLLLGPGIGFGLCVVGHCAVLEADLSLVPVEVVQPDLTVEYTAVTFSMRVLLRPLVMGRWSVALTGGALARLGRATTSEGVSRTVTDAGFRGTIELAYRVAGPVELLIELGVDGLVQRARFVRAERSILLEDAVTPWLVLGGRVRP